MSDSVLWPNVGVDQSASTATVFVVPLLGLIIVPDSGLGALSKRLQKVECCFVRPGRTDRLSDLERHLKGRFFL